MRALLAVLAVPASLLLVACGDGAPPAGGAGGGAGRDDGREAAGAPPPAAAAPAPDPAGWPAPGPARAGVDVLEIAAAGFERVDHVVDPRVGEATLAFHSGRAPAQAFLTVRLHPDVGAARAHLAAAVRACTMPLAPERVAGDVALGARGDGRLLYLAAARGNVTLIARAAGADLDLGPLVDAADKAVLAAPVLVPGRAPPGPRILGVEAAAAVAGRPVPLALAFDRALPEPAYVVFDAGPDAGVVRTETGYELHASRPGRLEVRLFACSRALQASSLAFSIDVRAGD